MKMRSMLVAALSLPWLAQAQLPPPSPEEAAKKQEAMQKKARDENTAKAALKRAQNRVAERYHAAHTPPAKRPVNLEDVEPIPELEASIEE
jgi:hypothetical protein